MNTVRVYPYFWPHYYAFYLEGIRRVFGRGCIHYTTAGFPQETLYNDGFAFEVEGNVPHRRIFISANDFSRIDSVALAWCDRYGMVNYDSKAEWAEDYPRVMPIGPSFGIQSWGIGNTLYHAIKWLMKSECRSVRNYLPFVQRYHNQLLNRLPEHQYTPGQSQSDYVFYVSWPWKKHPEANPSRERFIRASKSIATINFEGGFAPRRQKDIPGIEDITALKHYPFREYIKKIKRSSVVFNSPAVHQCLGWKLGEFLALGKAIISVPLTRTMPAPLIHGTHIHFVEDSSDAMSDAVEMICKNPTYRLHLETNARNYYLTYLEPDRVIQRLCGLESEQSTGKTG